VAVAPTTARITFRPMPAYGDGAMPPSTLRMSMRVAITRSTAAVSTGKLLTPDST